MNVIGISAFYHDSAAALVCDGKLVSASQEERFSRQKHDASFPTRAIADCLAQAGLDIREVEAVCFYEKPLLRLERALETAMDVAPRGRSAFARGLTRWLGDQLQVESALSDLGFRGELVFASHHESHAASAFFVSPFASAAILTVDGVGEWSTAGIWTGEGERVTPRLEQHFPHSIGLLYSALTAYLGFDVNDGEYKVMGLSPYGQPRLEERLLRDVVDLRADGSLRLSMEYFGFLDGDSPMWSPALEALLGVPPRHPGGELTRAHADLAASVQRITEEALLRMARHARHTTGAQNLCLAGGVALNCVATGKLVRAGVFDDVFVQPAAGDAGGAIGAAFVAYHHAFGMPRAQPEGDGMSGASLGPAFTSEQCRLALEAHGLEGVDVGDALPHRVVDLVERGATVGFFSGRMEFGPRALGHRSILADPRSAAMRSRVNQQVKFREGFRPFAPAVLESRCADWFEREAPSPYMSFVVPARSGACAPGVVETEFLAAVSPGPLGAVTHVDGSARVETVSPDRRPALDAVLREFHRRSGVPVILNTSFNVRGEPIVCTPDDACRSFLASGLDAMALETWIVERSADQTPTGVAPPARPLTLDPRRARQRALRSVALLVATCVVLVLVGRAPLALVPAATAALLVLAATAYPAALARLDRRLRSWARRFGRWQGTAAARLLHATLLSAIGTLRRRRGRSRLSHAPDPAADTYWVAADAATLASDYRRMY